MFQILNFLKRQLSAPHQETYEGYLPYFDDDSFPLKWHKAISESPSASSCVSTIADFLEGFGFSNTDLEKRIVNSDGETFFNIHHKVCGDFGEFEGFYIHFMFNSTGRKTEMRVFPFESCRLGKPDGNGVISTIYYNPFFGTEYKDSIKKHTQIYSAYDPKAVPAQILKEKSKYKGQILFVGTTTAASRFYPYPEAMSAVKWMRSEAGIADYHEDNINNGLHQPYMLIMKGNPNDPSQNPEYSSEEKTITVAEEFQEVIGRNFMGAKRVGNVMVKWVNIGASEETPQVLPLPTNATSDLFVTLDNQATDKILLAFKVPGILANVSKGGTLGGDGNMIRVAVKLMQQRCVKKQRILTDTYEMIFRNFEQPYTEPITIVPYNPYPELEVLDDKIWNELSKEEKRKWINDNTEIELEQVEPEAVATPDQPVQAKFKNAIPVGFPEAIRKNIQRALEHDEVMNKGCGKRGGKEVAAKIVNNESMGFKQLKRIHAYLKKRSDLQNSPWDDCEAVMYNQWGGRAMELFLESKLKEFEEWLN